MSASFSIRGLAAATEAADWRRQRSTAALSDVHRSIPVPAGTWRRVAAFLGPGYMVAVGYMDPGNWATSLAGGSKVGYTLLVVALVSNIMAIVLQSLCARLAIASGRDLAQACRERMALRYATFDSTLALMFALTINASILILAAASFHATGRTEVAELGEAHQLLGPLLGLGAPALFAVALLCCGLNSTVTAPLPGRR